jgi:hypothetical protein
MSDQPGLFDRATLAAWRIVNVAGWTALAFVVAEATHAFLTAWLNGRAALHAVAFELNARPGAEEGVDDFIAKFGLRIGLTVLIAFLVGSIVGLRVWRRQAFYAGVAAAVYVAHTLIAWEQSIGASIWLSVLYDLIVVSTIAIASRIAGRIASRRPAIPEVGLLAQELSDEGLPQEGR